MLLNGAIKVFENGAGRCKRAVPVTWDGDAEGFGLKHHHSGGERSHLTDGPERVERAKAALVHVEAIRA